MKQLESSKKYQEHSPLWHKHFKEGRDTLKDQERCGWKQVVDHAAQNQVPVERAALFLNGATVKLISNYDREWNRDIFRPMDDWISTNYVF